MRDFDHSASDDAYRLAEALVEIWLTESKPGQAIAASFDRKFDGAHGSCADAFMELIEGGLAVIRVEGDPFVDEHFHYSIDLVEGVIAQ